MVLLKGILNKKEDEKMMLHKGAVAKLQSTGRLATAPWGVHKGGEALVMAYTAIS